MHRHCLVSQSINHQVFYHSSFRTLESNAVFSSATSHIISNYLISSPGWVLYEMISSQSSGNASRTCVPTKREIDEKPWYQLNRI